MSRNLFEKESGKLYSAIPKEIRSFCEAIFYISEYFVLKEDLITFYPDDGRSFEELYEKADKALYKAKELGRRRYMVYRCGIFE